MNFRAKKSNLTKSLYVILVLCISGILILSLYSLFSQSEENENQKKDYKIQLETKSENTLESNMDNEDLLRIFGTAESTTTQANQTSNTNNTESPVERTTTPPPKATAPTDEPTNANETTNADTNSKAKADNNNIAATQPQPIIEVIASQEDIVDIETLVVPSFFVNPLLGTVSKEHNPDEPQYSISMNDYRTHIGIDIESDVGGPVKAVAQGEIVEIRDDPMMGKTVVLSHAGGYESIYMNLQENLPQSVTVGAIVKSGEIIGGVGETALVEVSDSPHLHFEMKKDGEYVDPLKYLEY